MEPSTESQGEDGFSLAGAALAVVGAGLMGGSVALALRGRVARLGIVEASTAVCEQATDRGLVDWAGGDLALAAGSDMVVLATPVRTLIRQIGELGEILKPGAVIVDLGSVKRPVVEAMGALPETIGAVGGHPMCGKEISGFGAAEPGLYRGVKFVLCRTARTTRRAWSAAGQLVEALGADPIEIEPGRHDRVVATVSHLPYVVAAALALAAGAQSKDEPEVWQLASSGFRDTSRLAGSDPTMMADILLENADAALSAIQAAEARLETLKRLIEAGDADRLKEYLGEAQRARRDWERNKPG